MIMVAGRVRKCSASTLQTSSWAYQAFCLMGKS
jgi:hypothetical protein